MSKFRRCTVAAAALLGLSLPASAQWMNNDQYPLDSVDIHTALDIMGFSIFKFPFSVPAGRTLYLNYIVDIYEDGELVKTINNYESLRKASLPPDLIAGSMPPLDTAEQFVRVYWRELSAGETSVRLSYGSHSYGVAFTPDDPAKFRLADCRAMNIDTKQLTGRMPIAVRYAHYADQDVISCPGSATVDQIRNLYGYVIVLSVEPIGIPADVSEK